MQTILPVLLRRRTHLKFRAERLELEDGDFLDLRWAEAPGRASGEGCLAIITHGLEGTADAGYICGTAEALTDAGWSVLAWSFRSCSGELNRLPRFYHSGETGDLDAIIQHAVARQPSARIALIGFSLGGNVVLKRLGEAAAHPAVVAAVAVSAPVDLASSAKRLDRERANRLYLGRFLSSLIQKVETKARHFPESIDARGVRNLRTFQEFDDRYTAPLHGFRDAEEYWRKSSARQYLPSIKVPALLLNAKDDPFLAPACFPFEEAEASACFSLEAPESGGHVGFLDLKRGCAPWYERRIVEWLETVLPVGGRASV